MNLIQNKARVWRQLQQISNMNNKDQIISKITEFLASREEIVFAYLFGSFLETERFRDIDLAVYLGSQDRRIKHPSYEIEMATILERLIKMPVDIIALDSVSDQLIYHASRGQLLKNDDDDLRVDFITRSWKRFFDFRPKLYEYLKEVGNVQPH